MNIKIALLQLMPEKTIQQNCEKGMIACRQAKKLGAHIALFPEMWLIGYDQEKMSFEYTLDCNSDFVQSYCILAKELDMSIVLTFLAKGNLKPKNMTIIIDRNGAITLEYAKVHICSFDEGSEAKLQPGDSFKVANLKLEDENISVGVMTCFDREFPESARMLAKQGAEIILIPNACSMKNDTEIGDIRLCQLRARAFENKVGIALTNYPTPLQDGHSVSIFPNGKVCAIANDNEQILIADLDIAFIRKWHKTEPWGYDNTPFKIVFK